MKKEILFFVAFLFISSFLKSQTTVPSEMEQIVDSLLQKSLSSLNENDFEKSFLMIDNAETIALENFDNESIIYGKICFYRANAFDIKTEYFKAEEWYLKSKKIHEKDKAQTGYLEAVSSLGSLYGKMGQYENSEQFLIEATTLHEEVFEKKHPDYLANLTTLGILYESIGQFEKAELFFIEAKNGIATTLGKEGREYAESLKSLGIFYGKTGKYAEAESLLLESGGLIEKITGKEHPYYAENLFIQGNLYEQVGNFSSAEQCFLDAKGIVGKIMGTENVYYGYCLLNLGVVYSQIGDFEKAELSYLGAIEVIEKTVGKKHNNYASALENMGVMYQTFGNHQKALPLLLESRKIREEVLGKEHPEYATSLLGLGDNYILSNDEKQAEILFLEAKTILENKFGKRHYQYGKVLTRLGNINTLFGNFEKAESFYFEANEIQKSLLIKGGYYLSEGELSEYIKSFIYAQNINLSFAQKYSKLLSTSYDNALFYKGFLLNAVKKISQLAENDESSKENLMKLKSYQRQLAVEYVKPIQVRKQIKELEEKAKKVKKELSRSVAHFGETIRQVKWEEVQSNLKPGEIAIEFLHYQFYNPKPTDSTMYVALLLQPGDEKPRLIPLFEEKALEELLKNRTTRRMDYVNNLYVNNAELLYNTIWKPLEKELSDVKTIYYAVSGLLHLVNIGAMSNSENEESILANVYQLRRLNSTRELVVAPERNTERLTASLFGGIRYESEGMPTINTKSDSNENSSTRGELVFSQVDSTLRGNREWQYLESTAEEITQVAPILDTIKLLVTSQSGNTATEESFKALSKTSEKASPNIIHIATHGYFFPNPSSNNSNSSDNKESVFKIADHPMIRSGLLFAGSNYAWKNGKPIAPGMEDGILTAYEISQMDLSDTELVVLSACETGLGDIQGNEGVYGLQRAFKIAGAKNILMSLWQVPDYQTKELMILFYKNWLEEKMEIHEALKVAQDGMREQGYEPFHWAGFVLLE
ncbi:MAG: CHAT domain-containing protein [Saprospiraceae bacterium]|jgi:CHAT domain-containing protein